MKERNMTEQIQHTTFDIFGAMIHVRSGKMVRRKSRSWIIIAQVKGLLSFKDICRLGHGQNGRFEIKAERKWQPWNPTIECLEAFDWELETEGL